MYRFYHPKEDLIINKVVELLAGRIRNGQYRSGEDNDYYYIYAILANTTYGICGYQLLDVHPTAPWLFPSYYSGADIYPLEKLDYEYVTTKLEAAVKEKIGAPCSVHCQEEEIRVERGLFRKTLEFVRTGRHGLSVRIEFTL